MPRLYGTVRTSLPKKLRDYNLFQSSRLIPASRMIALINPTDTSVPLCIGTGMILRVLEWIMRRCLPPPTGSERSQSRHPVP